MHRRQPTDDGNDAAGTNIASPVTASAQTPFKCPLSQSCSLLQIPRSAPLVVLVKKVIQVQQKIEPALKKNLKMTLSIASKSKTIFNLESFPWCICAGYFSQNSP